MVPKSRLVVESHHLFGFVGRLIVADHVSDGTWNGRDSGPMQVNGFCSRGIKYKSCMAKADSTPKEAK